MYYTCTALQKSLLNERPVISGRKIAFFIIGVLSIAVVVSEMTINLSYTIIMPKRTLWSKKLHLFLSFSLSFLPADFLFPVVDSWCFHDDTGENNWDPTRTGSPCN